MPNFRELGRKAEAFAADYLFENGYTILRQNFTVRGGEVDVIALDGETLVFVEVKMRRSGVPEDSIGKEKWERMTHAAQMWMTSSGKEWSSVRYDVIAIEDGRIRHHKGAGDL